MSHSEETWRCAISKSIIDVHAVPGRQWPASQSLSPWHPGPHTNQPGQIDGVVHGHRTPCCIPTGPCQVILWVPCPNPEGQPHVYQGSEITWSRWGLDSSIQGNLANRLQPYSPGTENGCMAISSTIRCQQDIAWSTGMEGYFIYLVLHQISGPSLTLIWMWCWVIHLPLSWLN